jgi:hypothetical protein
MTEWNLNCWFQGEAKPARPENEFLAYGMGAASYLHALLRVSDKVKIANQSMLVGTGWGITGIRVDTTESVRPQMYPTGMVTGLYARNHGNQLLSIVSTNVPYYQQALTLSGIKPAEKVAELDVVITANQSEYFVHVLNRSFKNTHQIKINFPEKVKQEFTQITLSEQDKGEMSEFAGITETKLNWAKQKTKLSISAKSVSVYRFEKDVN